MDLMAIIAFSVVYVIFGAAFLERFHKNEYLTLCSPATLIVFWPFALTVVILGSVFNFIGRVIKP